MGQNPKFCNKKVSGGSPYSLSKIDQMVGKKARRGEGGRGDMFVELLLLTAFLGRTSWKGGTAFRCNGLPGHKIAIFQ